MANYEYLDHTADIQIHAWGSSLQDAFVNAAYGMIDYMAPRTSITDAAPVITTDFIVQGRDLHALLFNFLDEILCLFLTEPHLHTHHITILHMSLNSIQARCEGRKFDSSRQAHGTEVKAITYCNMQIATEAPFDILVVIDI